jgi:magnesium-transporting ATPase (P-type)
MSFVIEETNGKIKLLSKGADSKVFTFLNSADKLTQDMLKATNKNLTNFASQGNRTLVFAAKTLDENEFKEWKEAYDNATVSLENRERKVEQTFEMIEKNMTLLGCTAVEDRKLYFKKPKFNIL